MPSTLIILLTPTKIIAPADQINAYQDLFRSHQNHWHPPELLRRLDQRRSRYFFVATKINETHQICCTDQIKVYQDLFCAHQNNWHLPDLLRQLDQRGLRYFFATTNPLRSMQICCKNQINAYQDLFHTYKIIGTHQDCCIN